jgi:hypothetical protein
MYRCLIVRAMTAERTAFQFYGPTARDAWAFNTNAEPTTKPPRHGKEPNGLEDARTLILAGDYEHAALIRRRHTKYFIAANHYRIYCQARPYFQKLPIFLLLSARHCLLSGEALRLCLILTVKLRGVGV